MTTPHAFKSVAALALTLTLLNGCQSRQDVAINQAKQQAAATGQPQQVVSADKNGNTTTTTVQPPALGQSAQAVTTTVTPAATATPAPGQYNSAPQSALQTTAQPVPGGDPIIRPADVNLPAGTSLAIRINQHLSVKSSHTGERFDGEIAEPVSVTSASGESRVILPRGTPVGGIVDASHRRGHFKGSSNLELRLTSLTLNGANYPLETHDYSRSKKGKGKRTAGFIGGGAGLGMLIGGIASGGTGLLIGGLAGGGAGTGLAAFTGNRDLEIPSEAIVRFKLADDLTLTP